MSATKLTTDELRDRLKRAPLDLLMARIRRARRLSGLSHDVIAERMTETGRVNGRLDSDERTFRQTLIGWERGKGRPRLDALSDYAEATGRQVEWFLDPDLDPSPFQEEVA